MLLGHSFDEILTQYQKHKMNVVQNVTMPGQA